jgi:hypothetical protein
VQIGEAVDDDRLTEMVIEGSSGYSGTSRPTGRFVAATSSPPIANPRMRVPTGLRSLRRDTGSARNQAR